MATAASPTFWIDVECELEEAAPGTVLFFERGTVPHPKEHGAYLASQWPSCPVEGDWEFCEAPYGGAMRVDAVRDADGRALWRVCLEYPIEYEFVDVEAMDVTRAQVLGMLICLSTLHMRSVGLPRVAEQDEIETMARDAVITALTSKVIRGLGIN
jgi:hypothetical protein